MRYNIKGFQFDVLPGEGQVFGGGMPAKYLRGVAVAWSLPEWYRKARELVFGSARDQLICIFNCN